MFATIAAVLILLWFVTGVWLMTGAVWPARTVPVRSGARRPARRAD